MPLTEAEKDAVHHGSDHSVAHRQSQSELTSNPNHRSVSGEWARGGDLVAGQPMHFWLARRDHTPHKDGVEGAAWQGLRCHEGGWCRVGHSGFGGRAELLISGGNEVTQWFWLGNTAGWRAFPKPTPLPASRETDLHLRTQSAARLLVTLTGPLTMPRGYAIVPRGGCVDQYGAHTQGSRQVTSTSIDPLCWGIGGSPESTCRSKPVRGADVMYPS